MKLHTLIIGLFFGILFTVILVGCKNVQNNNRFLLKTDSLLVHLDSSKGYFDKIDTLSLKTVLKNIKQRVNFLSTFKGNQVDSLFLEYGHRYQIFKHFLKEYPEINKELKFSKKQLDDLKHDLRYGILKNGKDSLFYTQEQKAFNHLRRQISLYYQRILEQNRQIKNLNMFMDNSFNKTKKRN